jgi:hypothetical protein
MSSFSTSQYGKFATLQNNSGSANAAAPAGGVYLYASGAVGSSKLYLNKEGSSTAYEVGSADLKIAGDSGTGTVSLGTGETFTIAGGTGLDTSVSSQTVTFSMDLNELSAAAVAVGADSIAIIDADDNGSKKESIADLATAMAGDGLVASSGVFAVNVADMGTSMTGDLADDDEFAISDGGTMKKVDFSVVRDAVFADVSGDAAVAAGGALTIAADAVESGMLNDNVISGQSALGSAAAAQADEMLFSDGGTLKKITFSNLEDSVFGNISGDATVAAGGALTIAANAVQTGMVHDDVATELAGNGLAAASGVMSLDLDELSAAAVDVSADSIAILDATDDGSKKESIADLATAMAGDGLAASSGVFAVQAKASHGLVLDSDSLAISGSAVPSAAAVAVGAHSIAYFDATGSFKQESIADLATAQAGAGLAASSGVLSVDIDELSALGGAGLHQTQDHFMFSDNGTEKKITFSNLQDAVFADVSGDATVAAGGALTIAADAVEGSMLNDNVISGQTELAHADIASADELMISDGGTLKKVGLDSLRDHYYGQVSGDATIADGGALTIAAQAVENSMLADDAVGADELAADAVVNASVASNAAIVATKLNFNVDFGGNVNFGSQSDDAVVFGGSIALGGNAIANAQGEATITLDNDQNVALAAAATVGGGYGSTGVTISSAGAISADGAMTLGSDGAGVNFKAFGGAANEYMAYDAGNHILQFVDSSGATHINIGGDATSEYAVDIANGSDNKNKMRAAAFVTYSDESLKQDVATMNTALDTVMSLNGVEFTWKDSGERDFGFIAQDVQSVLPKAVHTAADGVQGVDYSRLTSVLVEAVKAQQVQIDDLKKALKK